MHHKLKWMKDTLVCAVEGQLCNLHEADTKELGEAIDMIKDLEEAIYYCTITEAMNSNEYEREKGGYIQEGNGHQMYSEYPSKYHQPGRMPKGGYDNGDYYDSNSWDYSNYQTETMKDPREGRSPRSRKMYLEAKEYKDKANQLRELEKYMQELTSDIVEMIQDSSPEEKQYLEKKISALASKIGQMK